ncbi:MAG: hypothetical protein Athens071426_356 [Parcubacteria group bacterium Athens0714_26]|nr:MAG: hypothetical protein Athens071426_356 [Parcubacteria group bacterium Athens0714_26]
MVELLSVAEAARVRFPLDTQQINFAIAFKHQLIYRE